MTIISEKLILNKLILSSSLEKLMISPLHLNTPIARQSNSINFFTKSFMRGIIQNIKMQIRASWLRNISLQGQALLCSGVQNKPHLSNYYYEMRGDPPNTILHNFFINRNIFFCLFLYWWFWKPLKYFYGYFWMDGCRLSFIVP